MDPSFLDVLRALRDANVRFLVVGGVAVVLHGALRVTADLDLVVHDNVLDAVDVLSGLGFLPRLPVPMHALADPATRAGWRARNALVFTVWHPKNHRIVDLFMDEPFPFADAWARRTETAVGEVLVPLASKADLIAMKQAAGRHKDLADIDMLRALGGEDAG